MKEKIAITIDDKLLARLDRAVDGETIRNRSHAIEYYLHQGMGVKSEKALIMGGHADFSCATVFEGKAIVEHQVELLKKHGVKEILFCLHENEKEIQKMFGDGSKLGLRIHYQWQSREVAETGYMVSLAKKFFGDESFFVLYCHVVADIDLMDFAVYHVESNVVATVALTSIEDPSLYGSVKMRGEKIVEFTEKPKQKEEVSRVISAGIFYFSSEIFGYIPKGSSASLEKDVFPKLAKEGKMAGYLFEGKWCNVRNQIYARK